MIDFIFVRIHAMPCVNRCWHCFCEGSPRGDFMKTGDCFSILDQLKELKEETEVTVFPMFYDEPTLHPSFKELMLRLLEHDLIFYQWWFSTNGYGLARMSDDDWRELAAAGFQHIRLTFHGTEEMHDELVDRKGAYQDMITTIQRAERHGVDWLAGMMLSSRNQHLYEETKAAVEARGKPECEFGWMIPQPEGRALEDSDRVRKPEIARLLQGKSGWVTEGEFVERIQADSEMAGRSSRDRMCSIATLDVYQDMEVSYGGGCDGDPFAEMKSRVRLGNLGVDSISQCYDRSQNSPPEPLRILEETTWGELASRYGDRNNDRVYHYTSLVGHKWSSKFLKDHYRKDRHGEEQ